MYMIIKKPQMPVEETLVVKCNYSENFHGGYIQLYTRDSSTIKFLKSVCTNFGKFHKSMFDEDEYSLNVYGTFKAKEIADYIEAIYAFKLLTNDLS